MKMDGEMDRSRDELTRMARQHIDSLKAAGVQWVPVAPSKSAACGAIEPAQAVGAMISAEKSMFDESATERFGDVGERRKSLQLVAQNVSGCSRCAELARTRTQTVFGVGNIDQPEICFIGEAPGADEDARGEPFVGAAGQLLNKIITACGMKREEVYICNILKCRPPGNRLPLPHEAANCREYLDAQIELVRPKYICALGACAAQNLLNTTVSIGKLRGRFHEYHSIPVLCTYHPAFLLRSPDKKKDVWEDMKKLLSALGRPVK
jgi:DNA polymerase